MHGESRCIKLADLKRSTLLPVFAEHSWPGTGGLWQIGVIVSANQWMSRSFVNVT